LRLSRELVFVEPRKAVVRAAQEETLAPGTVLCRTILSGISHGTEFNMWLGAAPRFSKGWDEELRLYSSDIPPKMYPVRPGYETVALVEEVAPGVRHLCPGDLVWLDRPHRDWHIVPESEAAEYKLPQNMPAEQGIFVALTRVALTAIHDSGVKVGESAVVVGLGAVGLLIAQIARLAGCYPVIGVDPKLSRRRLANDYGFETLDPGADVDVARVVRSLTAKTGPSGADVVFEASGTYDGLALGMRTASVAGTIVAVSTYTGNAASIALGEEFHRNRLTLLASMSHNDCPPRGGYLWNFQRLMRTGIRLLADGAVDGRSMITHRLPLNRAADAYELISADPDVIKVALTYEPE
jgi:threonine dehydrogenase-like Zn-dependent dehydrogenase